MAFAKWRKAPRRPSLTPLQACARWRKAPRAYVTELQGGGRPPKRVFHSTYPDRSPRKPNRKLKHSRQGTPVEKNPKPSENPKKQKGGVMPVVHSRGHCKPLRSVFLPLQIARSFTCSVASLGQSPRHYLPGLHSLHYGALADYVLGQGKPSTWPTGLGAVPNTTSPQPDSGDRSS